MRKLKELLRLKLSAKLSNQQVARALNVSSSTVSLYHRAAVCAGITWPISASMNDQQLLAKLIPHCPQLKNNQCFKIEPDYQQVHQELRKKGVTLDFQLTHH